MSDPALFKRPYTARRQRNAAKRRPASPVSKLLLRVVVVVVLLVAATLTVIFRDAEQRPVATDEASPEAAPLPQPH